jgi:K+-sensing histidine kinase KdpD
LGQGVGLGLSLSREMVVAHGGTLRYQPGPRGGACFQITLPVCEE